MCNTTASPLGCGYMNLIYTTAYAPPPPPAPPPAPPPPYPPFSLASWTQHGGDAARSGTNFVEQLISQANVGTLELLFTTPLDGPTVGEVLVAPNSVVNGSVVDLLVVGTEYG